MAAKFAIDVEDIGLLRLCIAENNTGQENLAEMAARENKPEALDYLFHVGYHPWTPLVMANFIKNGASLSEVQQRRESGWPLGCQCMEEAVKREDYAILDYLYGARCPLNEQCMIIASVVLCSLRLMKWLHNKKCPVTEKVLLLTCWNRPGFCYLWDTIYNQHPPKLYKMINMNCLWGVQKIHQGPFTLEDKKAAIMLSPDTNILEWLYSEKCPKHKSATELAIVSNKLEALKVLRKHGENWPREAWPCTLVAKKGWVDMFTYLIENKALYLLRECRAEATDPKIIAVVNSFLM